MAFNLRKQRNHEVSNLRSLRNENYLLPQNPINYNKKGMVIKGKKTIITLHNILGKDTMYLVLQLVCSYITLKLFDELVRS